MFTLLYAKKALLSGVWHDTSLIWIAAVAFDMPSQMRDLVD